MNIDKNFQSRNSPGFDPSILEHNTAGAADEAVLNNVHKKIQKIPPFKKKG